MLICFWKFRFFCKEHTFLTYPLYISSLPSSVWAKQQQQLLGVRSPQQGTRRVGWLRSTAGQSETQAFFLPFTCHLGSTAAVNDQPGSTLSYGDLWQRRKAVFFLGFSLKMTDTFSGAPCPQLIVRTSSISTVSAVNAAVDGITRIVLQWRGLQCAVIILPRWLSGQDQFLDLGQESVC